MFDPSIGRWISVDPIDFEAEDANLFRYVRNDASNLTDPSGLQDRKRLMDLFDIKPQCHHPWVHWPRDKPVPVKPVPVAPLGGTMPPVVALPNEGFFDHWDRIFPPSGTKDSILGDVRAWGFERVPLPKGPPHDICYGDISMFPGKITSPRVTRCGTAQGWSGIVPDGRYVGLTGCGSCVGVVLIPPKKGMYTYVLHFGAKNPALDGFKKVGFAREVSDDPLGVQYSTHTEVLKGYRAVICGAENTNGNDTTRHTLLDVTSFLRKFDVSIQAYIPAAEFLVDAEGKLYWTANLGPNSTASGGLYHK